MAIETTDIRGIIVDAGPPTSGPTARNPALVPATTFYYDTVGLALYQNLPVGVGGVLAWIEVRSAVPQETLVGAGPFAVAATTRSVYVANVAVAVTVNLPTLVGFPNGDEILVKKIDAGAGTVTVDAFAAETIDGALTFVIPAGAQNDVLLRADVAALTWRIVSTIPA